MSITRLLGTGFGADHPEQKGNAMSDIEVLKDMLAGHQKNILRYNADSFGHKEVVERIAALSHAIAALKAKSDADEKATRLPTVSGYNTSKNPIYVAYYSHEECDCYKIDLPFTKYARDTRVLCKVSEGLELATARAKDALAQSITDALAAALEKEGAKHEHL